MAKKSNYHVVPDKEHGWAIRKAGADRVSGFAATQKTAESAAKKLASKGGGGEVVTHGRDGRIRDKDTMSPARDPFPPRDRRH